MTLKLALFQLRGEFRALSVGEIHQVLLAPPVFPLPLLPGHFAGVMLHKGELIPVLTADRLAVAGQAQDSGGAAYFIVCATEFGPVGLPADRVLRIVELTAGQMQDGRAGHDDTGIFCFKGEQYPLVQLEILLGLQPRNRA